MAEEKLIRKELRTWKSSWKSLLLTSRPIQSSSERCGCHRSTQPATAKETCQRAWARAGGGETCWRASAVWSWPTRATEMSTTWPLTYHSTGYCASKHTKIGKKIPLFSSDLAVPLQCLPLTKPLLILSQLAKEKCLQGQGPGSQSRVKNCGFSDERQ